MSNECCKAAAKDAVKDERRRIREVLATLPEAARMVATEAIFGAQTQPPEQKKPKWVDLSTTEVQ